jgi:enamine deaminase RidA (YjgF/YER057c/UK114 family)
MSRATDLTPEQRLTRLGIELPRAQTPLSQHLPVVISGNFAFVSGHGPMDPDRNPVFTGPVGSKYSVEEGAEAARLAALNAISSVRAAIGGLDQVTRVVKLTGFVLSASGFERQPWVVDGASDLLVQAFGESRGAHARTSIGVGCTALSMTVTLEIIFEVANARAE